MKLFFVTLVLTQASFASSIYCRGDLGNLLLSLSHEEGTFSFTQFCWNPCNMGEGEIISGPRRSWGGIHYELDLNRSHELIAPLNSREMSLFLEHDGKTGILSDGKEKINVKCEAREET